MGYTKYEWPVSTGKAGYSTPSGKLTATSMNEIWYSKEWDNAPMPHSVFFRKDGYAIHGSLEVRNLGRPASHGCVRISPENAATFYRAGEKGWLEEHRGCADGRHSGRRVQGRQEFGSPLRWRRTPTVTMVVRPSGAVAIMLSPQWGGGGYYGRSNGNPYYTDSQGYRRPPRGF